MSKSIFIFLLLVSYCYTFDLISKDKPRIALSFDDGSTNNYPFNPFDKWNSQLLKKLKNKNLKAGFFVRGDNKLDSTGKALIKTWDIDNHLICNHSYSHRNFNSSKVETKDFELDLLQADSIIKNYNNYTRLYRFPYLKEGNTDTKVLGYRDILTKYGYKNGHVTVDASDWYIDSRLVERLKKDSLGIDITTYRNFYINHLYSRALFYDSLSTDIFNRKLSHVLLLHHNLSASLFIDSLIEYFEANGWEVIDIDSAFKDKLYDNVPLFVPAGESLIWQYAKQSGKYNSILRYPAEDAKYEKPLLDSLGL